MKSGILLAAFGSGSNQGEAALRHFETCVRERFPGVALRWAFTSVLMRERLASARKKSDSVRKALDKMAFERFTHVAVQPLHVISGVEYSDILADVERLRPKNIFVSLVLGTPLLTDSDASVVAPTSTSRSSASNIISTPASERSIDRVADALLAALPRERRPDEAVLFMGHGTRHAAERLYEALSAAVQVRDPRVFMGTLNGTRRLEHLLPHLHAPVSVSRVWLMPFLAVVGRHTLEDMAGASERSWLSRLEAEHIPCIPVLKGMIEHQSFSAIWIDHLAQSMDGW